MYKKIAGILFFFFVLFLQLQAQEQLRGLSINPNVQKQSVYKSTLETALFLPFFDDFKQDNAAPNPALWANGYAFVNTGFQKFPTNIGVATLDALDENGEIYARANSFSFIADSLTSNAIRLDSLADEKRPIYSADSLYLSFYYQPQGKGNAPESSDSLVLEFYSGRDKLWYPVWSDQGMPLDSFYVQNQTYCKQVLIPITDSARFYHPNFKFRFYNYASLASSVQSSWQSNADQWNIDFVKLDIGRSRFDIYSDQLVFVNPPPSFLKQYRQMPYNQYKNDPTNAMADTLHSIYISNLSANSYAVNYQYSISNQFMQDSIYSAPSAYINPFIIDGYSDFQPFKDPKVVSFFSLYDQEAMEYTITHSIKTLETKNGNRIGDTLIQKQFFGDCFAYDDGSAEAGYGLSKSGNSAALHFKLNTSDTLTQVQFYFNPTFIRNTDYFYLKVWESIDPEVILYEKLVQVTPSTSVNGFVTYTLDDLVLVSNSFFVGFTQTSDKNLNIGFDLSYAPEESLFFNAGNGWESSIFEGALMIRPVFAHSAFSENIPADDSANTLHIFPNPLKYGQLNIQIKDGINYAIHIYTLLGKLVYNSDYQEQINIDFLKEGLYILRLENKMNSDVKSQKLIIRK
ncbi:MAG: T9SS type A sorting domain-containing protein [Bacteroidales bacterium]|nr:T9SS type A sorting domain-containing protein [Bacteroidales bacterium]